jgi:hypothetical protein
MQTNYVWTCQLRTNYPSQLRGLAPRIGPFVNVNVSEDTNEPPFVMLQWGSGFLGATGFYIGRTNFVMPDGYRKSSMWRPGVYFFRR